MISPDKHNYASTRSDSILLHLNPSQSSTVKLSFTYVQMHQKNFIDRAIYTEEMSLLKSYTH